MIYFTSDLHFGHDKIIEYCNRPFISATKMNNALINNWNQIIHKDDEVFVLGDFSLSTNKESIKGWVSRLNGIKHLVLGNHDELKVWDYVSCGFTSVHTVLKLTDKIYLAHDPAIKTALPEGSILLHGHVHCLWRDMLDKGLINIGTDVWGFKPVSLEQIKQLIGE